MNLKDLYWVAGILEGEGTFYLHTGSTRVKLSIKVKMTDDDVIERLLDITGIGYINGPYNNGGHKPVYVWSVTNQRDAAALMMTVYSIMGGRRQRKIQELIEIWKKEFDGRRQLLARTTWK